MAPADASKLVVADATRLSGRPPAADKQGHAADKHGADDHAMETCRAHKAHAPVAYTGNWLHAGEFGDLKFTISYYIDALTVCMFTMVTSLLRASISMPSATCTMKLHDITDREVLVTKGYRGHGHGGHGPRGA